MSEPRTTIDGRSVDPKPDETILQCAARAGVEIPTLCHRDELRAEGWCRLCLVEPGHGDKLRAACHTRMEPTMTVRTDTPRLRAVRREVLDLIVSQPHLVDMPPVPDGTALARLMADVGVETSGVDRSGGPSLDDSHPYLCFDASRCITCRLCLNTCEQVQGQFVYGVEGRGADARIIFGPEPRFADSACTACGACVDACPTAALSDRDRADGVTATSVTSTVCGYCGVGCRLDVESADNRVQRISAPAAAAVNRGHLCLKGRYAHAYHHADDRLTRPLLREGSELKPVSWATAIGWLAERLEAIRAAHGPDALGAMSSSRSTNESAYLLQKLFRTRIGTNNVDCCARVCHSSTALALRLQTGTGAASASYEDLDVARCFVVAGANPTEAHPVVGARIKQRVLAGATLVVIDPRRIELTGYADVHLQLRPGTNVALFNGLAKVLIEGGLIDDADIAARTEGFEALRAFVEDIDLDETQQITGVDRAAIERAARIMGEARQSLFISGLGLSETTQGTASVMTLCNLGLLTGSIGRPGAGMLPLRGQNNVQGNADMGGAPALVTGYQALDDDAVRTRLQTLWGTPPPIEAGLTLYEMVEAARAGTIRGLWIQGEDIAQSDPDQTHVLEALERLELLVVQELFMSETARYAHLVLPAAAALEQSGTFTNGERRIQRVRPAVDPPGEARPDWEVIRDTARAMGASWTYAEPDDVMDEIAQAAPHLFGGISYDRLGPDGLQWPCSDRDHPGTPRVHADGFIRGKGKIVSIDYVPAPERVDDDYPYLLVTGRVLEHYNVGTMTRRTPNRELVDHDALEMHPEDARRRHLAEGDLVEIASRWGRTRTRIRTARRIAPGTLFLSFHFPRTHTNRLVGPHLDPQSKCPDYKVTAVRVQRVEGS